MITLNYRLNIYQEGIPQVVHLSQYDSDFTLLFGLYSNFGTFTLEEGTTAELRCTKPDGNGYSKSGTVSGTTVTIEGDNQLTACSGCFPAEITLFKDGKELNTVNFTVSVERAALDAGTIESETVLEELQAIIDGAEEATRAATDAQAAQEAAEAAAEEIAQMQIMYIGTDGKCYTNMED